MNRHQTRSDLPLTGFAFESPVLNERGEVCKTRQGQQRQWVEKLGRGISILMVAIPGGTFQMGSPPGVRYEDEVPPHLVSLAPFLIARSPITQEQWQKVVGKPPRCRFQGRQLPVENISWIEAEDFCRRLAHQTGRAYDLPSEAQWEYACRAGTSTPFSTGLTITTDYANYVGDFTFRDEPRGVYRHTTTPAGQFPPNPFGLYDMHGNLWEWCADLWHLDYTAAPCDGTAWTSSGETGYRVARGGSWHEPPTHCRSAVRLRYAEKEREDYVGFRVVLDFA